MKGSGVGFSAQEFVYVLNMISCGWVGWWEVECVGGVCVNMNGALPVHKGAERKYKEGNVSAATTFINVEPSDVFVVVDVMTNERRSNEGVEDVIV